MTVKVTFMKPRTIGGGQELALGFARLSETITVPGSTTGAAEDGEMVILVSTEPTSVVAANGTTPDAAATQSTAVTSAGYGVPPGAIVPVRMFTGDKINIKAFV